MIKKSYSLSLVLLLSFSIAFLRGSDSSNPEATKKATAACLALIQKPSLTGAELETFEKLLLQADPNSPQFENGRTLLIMAFLQPNIYPQVISALRVRGANSTIADRNGITVYHLLSRITNPQEREAMKLMLENEPVVQGEGEKAVTLYIKK
jgi:hypothetical protein